ncbi:hypothetical protein M2316_001585 [Cellulosimicrobium cellulans]|nr:hypothetical protein [Cellulosimicrobium cellulans]
MATVPDGDPSLVPPSPPGVLVPDDGRTPAVVGVATQR